MKKTISNQEPESFLLGTASEEEQLDAVREDGFSIQYITNPSEEVQLEAVKEYGYAIHCITNPYLLVRIANIWYKLINKFK